MRHWQAKYRHKDARILITNINGAGKEVFRYTMKVLSNQEQYSKKLATNHHEPNLNLKQRRKEYYLTFQQPH